LASTNAATTTRRNTAICGGAADDDDDDAVDTAAVRRHRDTAWDVDVDDDDSAMAQKSYCCISASLSTMDVIALRHGELVFCHNIAD